MKKPKHILVELPTADEIDNLAMSTPSLEVRKFEYDMKGDAADLDYAPCKGKIILVIRGEAGTVLMKDASGGRWHLPSDLIRTYESVTDSVTRVAKENCDLSLRSIDLVAMYDVVSHYDDVTVKRLHIVFAAVTDDRMCGAPDSGGPTPEFHVDVDADMLATEIDRTALNDASPE